MAVRSGLAFLLLLSANFGLSAEPTPSPSIEDNVPSHTVSILQGADPLRVGDTLVLKVPGTDPMLELASEVSTDDGWFVEPLSPPEAGQTEFRFKATPIKPGNPTLPSPSLKAPGGEIVAKTAPLSLRVQSNIAPNDPKPSEPAPMQPPIGLPFPWWLVVVFGIAALLIAAVVAYLLYRLSRPESFKLVELPKQPPLPEDEEALKALALLESQSPLHRGEFKPHYFALSEIFKAYLGRRYHFDALECTSGELIRFLENKGSIPEKLVKEIDELYRILDRVKFTDHLPPKPEGIELLRQIRLLVLNTRRPPAPTTLSSANAEEPKK